MRTGKSEVLKATAHGDPQLPLILDPLEYSPSDNWGFGDQGLANLALIPADRHILDEYS